MGSMNRRLRRSCGGTEVGEASLWAPVEGEIVARGDLLYLDIETETRLERFVSG